MNKDERHKCVVIPVIKSPDAPTTFLTVRDKRHKEWTFITGGCRKREIPDPIKCAMRELDEETRSTFSVEGKYYKYFSFVTKNRSPEELERDRRENLDVTCIYHVYIFVMDMQVKDQLETIKKFNRNKDIMDQMKKQKRPIKRSHDENDILSFDTYEELMKKKLWEFILKNVIEHKEFEEILTEFFVN